MNHRERLLTAMRCREPDRVPYDIRLTAPKYDEFVERTGGTDPDDYFDLDYRHVTVRPPQSLPDYSRYFAGRVPDWPDMSAPDFRLQPWRGSTDYFVMGEHKTAMNEWGEYRIYGDARNYHQKVYPLGGDQCTMADIEAYPFPDLFAEYRYQGLEEEIRAIHERELAAVLFWEMTIFEKSWRIRGMEELMMDFIVNPDLVERLMDEVARRTGYLATRYAQAGVDIIQFGDDIGSQGAMMISPNTWRRFLKPRLAKIIADVKTANPDVLVFYHSDGSFNPVIPDLIEIGIDILNPIQPESMNIAKLKKLYGDRLSFWGGIGVQTTLPFGTPDDVQSAVKRLIEDAGGGGGLVVSPAHVIEPDVPWENVETFVEAVRRYGSYSG
jgi:uroporphyrinogen decarboxylase